MGEMMTREAMEMRKEYQRRYRDKNRDRINAKKREWNARNPEKLKAYRERHWEKMALKKRVSWEKLGIDKKQREKLKAIAKKDAYADIVAGMALKVDRLSAGHIILSVTKGLSYEAVEFDERLGRCPVCKTVFYAERRLFYYYLDQMLKEQEGIHG